MKRVALIVIAMVVVLSILFVVGEQRGWMEESLIERRITEVRDSAGGRAGVAGAVIGLLVVDILLPIPSSIVMVLSGKFLGSIPGGAAAFIGAMLAAAIGFYACRFGGQRVFLRLVGTEDTARLSDWFERYGVYAIIVSRPIPMLTEILSCLAGMSKMSAKTFFGAAVLGTLPICFVYSFCGSRGSVTDMRPAVAVALLIPAIGWLIARRIKSPQSGAPVSEPSRCADE